MLPAYHTNIGDMNIEKFSDRAKGFLQSAQTVALRMGSPAHHARAPSEGAARGRAGHGLGPDPRCRGEPSTAAQAVDLALSKQAKVTGGGAQNLSWDNDTARILDQAEQIATKAGDSFVTVERLLMALALATTTDAGRRSRRPA